MRRGAAVLSAGCALVLALAACGTSSGDGGGIKGVVKAAGGPPAGGWPQPVNGQLTPAMCGLLTDADYARYGHDRLSVDSQKRVDNAPNAIDCLYMTEDDLNISLQPTAEAAKLAYAHTLKGHKDRLTEDSRPTILAPNVVPGADESWFDYWTLGTADSKYKEYEIQVRRGSLLVGMILGGLKGKKEQDPRTVLSGLAGLVLQRIPNVGRTDSGTTTKARFSVVGTGRAEQINYFDPATSKSVTLKNVKLPWHVERPVVALGEAFVMMSLSANSSRSTSAMSMNAIGCNISVNGETIVEQAPQIGGLTSCMKTYTPPK